MMESWIAATMPTAALRFVTDAFGGPFDQQTEMAELMAPQASSRWRLTREHTESPVTGTVLYQLNPLGKPKRRDLEESFTSRR